jgi:hypothetical protein
VAYPPASALLTSRRNPVEHTYADVGRYFALGDSDADVRKVFPSGLAGELQTEFDGELLPGRRIGHGTVHSRAAASNGGTRRH